MRMLLNHTSGLPDYTDGGFESEVIADPRRRWTTSEFLDRTAALPRAGAPGERFNYSNANYNLLGLIIERATGKPWRTVVRERIFERLHLTHTSLPEPGDVPAGRDIAPRLRARRRKVRRRHRLLTTAEDLSRFLRATVAGRLFRHKQTAHEMPTFVAAHDENGLTGYGLGLERYLMPDGVKIIGHVGTAGGYRTVMFHLPAQDIDLTITMNQPDDLSPLLFPALKVLLAVSR